MTQIFISYSRVDTEFTQRFVDRLRRAYDHDAVWYDDDLHGGARWWQTILTQIAACEVFIYLLSNESVTSRYCQAEFNEARRLQKPIVTVQVRDRTQLSADLGEIHYINMGSGMNDDNISRLFGSINRMMRLPKVTTPLWMPITPLPTLPNDETAQKVVRAEVDTPPLAATPPVAVPIVAEPPPPPFDMFTAMDEYVDRFDSGKLEAAQALLKQIRASGKAPRSFRLETHEADLAAAFAAHAAPAAARQAQVERDQEYGYVRRLAARPNPSGVWESLQEFWKTYPGHDPDNLARFAPPPPDPVTLALSAARSFAGKRNRDWTPFTAVFKGSPIPDMKFCLVPVGSFQMGGTGEYDGKPIHPQKLDQPYWIAQTPVTNAQWQIAVKAGVVKAPVGNSALSWYQEGQMANAPVVGVDWRAATTFAEWLGARLLTELEWEYAARGVESWVYPWGDTWVPDNAVVYENSGGRPNAVTTRPQGASWVGALHLSGNVWEWTSSLFDGYPYVLDNKHEDATNRTNNRVLRGGSWSSNGDLTRAAYRYNNAPDLRSNSFGFRVGLAVVSY